MGTQITPTGIKFPNHDEEQTAPVRSVNSTAPDASGNIEVAAGGGATYTSQDYHATTDFLFKDSKWYGEHMVYSYSTNASAIENLSVGSVLHEVGSDLSFSVVSIDAAANRITLNRGDFVDLGTSNKTLEDRENSTFGSTTFTYVSGTGNSINCTNIWLQVIGNQNNANTESLPTSNNSVANLPMKLDHLPSMATHIIFRVSSETGGSFKIYNRETFNVRPPTAELLPSEIVHQIDVEGAGTQAGFSEFRVPVNSYFRFWVTGGAKANLYPVGYSVLDLSEIDLQSASNPVITDLETRVNTLETNDVVTTVNGQTGDVTVSGFDGDYNSLDNKPTIPTDLDDLTDNNQLLSSGGGGYVPISCGSGATAGFGAYSSYHNFKNAVDGNSYNYGFHAISSESFSNNSGGNFDYNLPSTDYTESNVAGYAGGLIENHYSNQLLSFRSAFINRPSGTTSQVAAYEFNFSVAWDCQNSGTSREHDFSVGVMLPYGHLYQDANFVNAGLRSPLVPHSDRSTSSRWWHSLSGSIILVNPSYSGDWGSNSYFDTGQAQSGNAYSGKSYWINNVNPLGYSDTDGNPQIGDGTNRGLWTNDPSSLSQYTSWNALSTLARFPMKIHPFILTKYVGQTFNRLRIAKFHWNLTAWIPSR